jgi:two-component system nitrogen regulation response regulator GlnG
MAAHQGHHIAMLPSRWFALELNPESNGRPRTPNAAGAQDGDGEVMEVSTAHAFSEHSAPTLARVLVVDDDLALLHALPDAIRLRMSGLTVDTANSAEAALNRIATSRYAAIVTDIKMPGMDGLTLLAEIRTRYPDTPTLLITGHGEHALAIEALRGGAFDFIQKPIDREYFVASLRRAIQAGELRRRVKEHKRALERRADQLEQTVEERTRELHELRSVLESPLRWFIGPSRQLQKVIEQIFQVAKSPLTVLLQGETGTGKELAARAIHHLSVRRSQPFVAIDCGAIPDTLIESELFGHERGAFTGAHQRKEGKFQIAGSGTVFLDEIGNLPVSTQAKLLRVLQERAVEPLGSTRSIRIEARVIAASNAALDREVQAGRFRQDLYYRLNEFTITLPPLRARDDIIHLAKEFVTEASVEFGRPCLEISDAAAQVLQRHSWPGNVRELRNTIRRAVLLAGDVIEPQHLPVFDPTALQTAPSTEQPISAGRSLREIAEEAAANAERQAIRDTLHLTKGNKREAARLLRTDYKTLHVKMKQYGILPRQV